MVLLLRRLLLTISCATLATAVSAEDYYWAHGSGDYYSINTWERHPTIWIGSVGWPGSDDRAIYYSGGTVSLEFGSTPQDAVNQTVIVQGVGGQTNFNLRGKQYQVTGNAFTPGNLRVTNAGAAGAYNVQGTLYVGDLEAWGSYGRNVQVDSGGRVQAGTISLTSFSGVGGESFDVFDGEVSANTLYIGPGNSSGSTQFNLHSSSSSATFQDVAVGNFTHTAAGAELNVIDGNLDISGNIYLRNNAKLQIASGNEVSIGGVYVGGTGRTDNHINLYNGSILKANSGVAFASGWSMTLENAILDAGTTTNTGSGTVSGYGVLIGNSAGLTVASPNGAVDTSYDMNIGSRRADIFSNGPATLRGDVSLSTGGLLNSAQIVHLIGSEYTQNGGTTNIGNQFQIDNSVMYLNGGLVDTSGGIRVGMSNGSSSLLQTGGDITGSSGAHVIIGAGGDGVYNISGGTLTTKGAGYLVVGDNGTSSTGTVTQSGGSINTREVVLSNGVNTGATYNLSDGTINILDSGQVIVGNHNDATFHQTGGVINAQTGTVNIGHSLGSDGSHFQLDGGTVNAGMLRVGNFSDATMTQTAGDVNIGTEAIVGHEAGSNSTYTISGGTFDTGTDSGAVDPDLEVGYSGTGTFNQSGGVVTVADELVIGHNSTGNGKVNLSGGTLNVSKDAGTGVYVGFRGTGELAVSGTGQLSTQSVVSVGTDVGSIGTVTQTGGSISAHQVILADAAGAQATYSMQGGTLNTASHLYVGESDMATYTQTGGDVTVGGQFRVNHGSMATINNGTLHSVDSLRIGTSGGLSSMTQNGGLVKTDEYFAIGSGGNGTYTITGGTLEAKAVSRGLYVGTEAGATGSMNQSGGHVDVGDLVVGNGSAQSGEYMLSNGRIDARDRIVVGNHVVGTFTQTGGRVDSLNATIIVGNTAGADGSHYQVDGGLTETSGLWVGNYGDATFTQTGGYVDASGVVIAREATSTASYSLEGGRLWSSGTVSFGDGVGSFELDGGILDVNTLDATGGSFTFTSGTLQADQILGMNLAMSDGLLDVGTLNGDLSMSGGILAPGNSPGVMTITGDYLLSGGMLDMELAGLSQGTEFDFVDINGNWTITGGDLQVSLLGGFTPTVGNSFDLFDFNSLTGTFDNLFLPTLTGSLAWDTSSLYTSGTISVLDATAVPEPSTFAFIAIGMGLFAWRRRRTQA